MRNTGPLQRVPCIQHSFGPDSVRNMITFNSEMNRGESPLGENRQRIQNQIWKENFAAAPQGADQRISEEEDWYGDIKLIFCVII